jgi:hypothetical protein
VGRRAALRVRPVGNLWAADHPSRAHVRRSVLVRRVASTGRNPQVQRRRDRIRRRVRAGARRARAPAGPCRVVRRTADLRAVGAGSTGDTAGTDLVDLVHRGCWTTHGDHGWLAPRRARLPCRIDDADSFNLVSAHRTLIARGPLFSSITSQVGWLPFCRLLTFDAAQPDQDGTGYGWWAPIGRPRLATLGSDGP